MTNKNEIAWKTDTDGMLLGARAHDGKIVNLSYSKKIISLRIERLGGSVVEFELDGVAELNLALWEGTILSEIFVWKLDSFKTLTSVASHQAWEFLYRERVGDLKTAIARTIKKSPELLLVHVSSSYGGEIATICSRMSIYEEK